MTEVQMNRYLNQFFPFSCVGLRAYYPHHIPETIIFSSAARPVRLSSHSSRPVVSKWRLCGIKIEAFPQLFVTFFLKHRACKKW